MTSEQELAQEIQRLMAEGEGLRSQVDAAEKARMDVERKLSDAVAEMGRLRQAIRNTVGSLRLEADALERDLDDSNPV